MDFPIGTIILWKNTTIPAGWVVCDGNNGTPSLINRFVRGANDDSDLRASGGSYSHTHTVPNTNSVGSHNHGGTASFSASGAGGETGTDGTGSTNNPQSHGHDTITAMDITYEGGHSHTTSDTGSSSTLPKHIKRVFIKKVSE
jgi:hypothetical protein